MIIFSSKIQAQLPYGEYKAMTVTGGATLTGSDNGFLTGTVDGTGSVTVQANYVKSSGVVVDGGMKLFLSNDGIVYYPYPSGRELTGDDTLNIASALSEWNLNANHASMAWTFKTNDARFYQVRVWTGATGSPVGIISGEW